MRFRPPWSIAATSGADVTSDFITGRAVEAVAVRQEAVLVGLRPGELRRLTWDLVDLNREWPMSGAARADPVTPRRRSPSAPSCSPGALTALTAHRQMQDRERAAAGRSWQGTNLVFCHEDGSMYSAEALNWRFSKMTRKGGIGHWHAHEGRCTAVSIMSSNGVPIQDISDTVGHKSTHVTETVYRHVNRPTVKGGATVMDEGFKDDDNKKPRPAIVAIDSNEFPKYLVELRGCEPPDLLHAM